jgi:FKBP-type peptidyl-prolyl cis-trans isomerase FkpA
MKKYSILFLLVFVAFGCKKKEDASEQATKDEEAIKSYISSNNLTAIRTDSGLYYVIQSQGTGVSCNANSTVTVLYEGKLTNGNVFDSSPAQGATFGLQNVIRGWTEGIPYFKEGGVGTLIIPSALGYGASGTNGIPANSVLVFNIQLIDVL